jgi:hypothetical protein
MRTFVVFSFVFIIQLLVNKGILDNQELTSVPLVITIFLAGGGAAAMWQDFAELARK